MLEAFVLFGLVLFVVAFLAAWAYTEFFRLDDQRRQLQERLEAHASQLQALQAEHQKTRKLVDTAIGMTRAVHLDDEVEAMIAEKREQYKQQLRQVLQQEFSFFANE
jgi:predicted Holliday junction resolvase-like endonuclease